MCTFINVLQCAARMQFELVGPRLLHYNPVCAAPETYRKAHLQRELQGSRIWIGQDADAAWRCQRQNDDGNAGRCNSAQRL